MPNLSGHVILKGSYALDDNVVLGYKTPRSIPTSTLAIGSGANIRYGTVIYEGSKIGSGLETGHNVVIREENNLGNDVGVWGNSVIDYGCQIGNNVKIHTGVYVAQFTTIEDDVFLGPGVTITNDPHPLCADCTKENGPTIKRGARIGANVTILPGVVVGEHALIGAGSVVTRDMPARKVAYGNPAKVYGDVDSISCPHDPDGKAYVDGLDRNTRKKQIYSLELFSMPVNKETK